jgi:CheY-like chemotaxis protein
VELSCRSKAGQGPELHCAVRDSGIGLSDESRQKLFQPFAQADISTTRRFGGTGLGLAICSKLVKLMGGTIGVTSAEGKGSTFWFDVCLENSLSFGQIPGPGLAGPRIQDNLGDGPLLKVLLAEDNVVNQKVATLQFRKVGCDLKVVGNGREALAAWLQGGHDIIFMDCQMPEMDGFETTRQIRALEKERSLKPIRIVAMTASAMRGDREECMQAGMDDYLSKPAKTEEIKKLLRRIFPGRLGREGAVARDETSCLTTINKA